MTASDRIRITKAEDGSVIWLWRNGSTLSFSPEGWIELQALMLEFAAVGRAINFVEETPQRVAVAPQKPGSKLASLNLADLGL